jgi:hypothetical protein
VRQLGDIGKSTEFTIEIPLSEHQIGTHTPLFPQRNKYRTPANSSTSSSGRHPDAKARLRERHKARVDEAVA